MNLREASCGQWQWPVEVLFDRQRKMYLDAGFEKFFRTNSLEVGCLLVYRYEGNDDMHVSVFDDSSCRRHYHSDDSDEGNDDFGEDSDGHL
ncbi:hypothetical protein ACQ4PT_021444 [Festuca glaucescens]